MAQTVVIDIEAQYRDKTSAGVKSSTDDMERMRKKMEETESAGKKANAALEKIATTAAQIAKKTISIPVKLIDYATKPLRSLIGYATSLRGILTGIVMGQTAQKLFVSPTQYAETLKTHSLAFENLLGSAEAAQQMIQEIQAFDEKSPFNTMQIIEQSRMLMTYKLATQENVLSMIETIGDAAMGVGAGDEGIERIVRALGQMKAKGKVSAEEMLQLSEVNISGWQYLADALGVSTAEVQDMTSKNKVNVDDAINYLLEGMRKDFGGMANENAAKTLSGVWGQISSVLENGPFLRWGQGLSEGAMMAATTASGWLEDSKDAITELGDELYALGKYASTYAADKIIDFGDRVKEVLGSEEFKNADGLGDKLKIAWDRVIAEPFDQWLESEGQEFLGDVAGKIGMGLGKFYNGAITTILGIDAEGAAEGGVNIGAKFAEGFLEGFDAAKVWEAIKGAFSNAMKIIPGGEEATTGSWISAALLGYGGLKVAGAVKPLVSGAGSLAGSMGGAAVGSTKAAELAISLGSGNLAGGASLSAGALSAIGIGSAAGGIAGGLGLISGMADLTRALDDSSSQKEKSVSGWSAASKFSMVGAGAGVGAAIGSVVPVIGTAAGALIGAGIGGIGAIFGGGKAGRAISDMIDGTAKINEAKEAIVGTSDALVDMSTKASLVTKLTDRYEELNKKISSGSLGTDELAQAQSELQGTIEALASIYPNLISQYDIENNKLGEKLSLLRDISQAERDRARDEAELAVAKGEQALPDMEKKILEGKSEYSSYDKKAMEYAEAAAKFQDLATQWNAAVASNEAGKINGEELKKQLQEIRIEAKNLADESGIYLNAFSAQFGASSLYGASDTMSSKYVTALEARQAAQENIDELMSGYEELYKSYMSLALNPESLDDAGGLSAVMEKVQELTAIQEERLALEKELASLNKGSDQYDETAKKIDEAKTKEQELTDAIAPYKDALSEVLTTIQDINKEFDLLGDKRLNLDDMGLNGLYDYAGKSTTPASGKIGNKKYYAYASGTLSAPPGMAWVGEEGPELMRMRGGERIYNAADSLRIAAENARDTGRRAGTAGGIQVNLGGLNVSITGGGDSQDIMEQIRAKLPEIGNELCAMIATQISRSYANMPTTVEGI